jgi:hypothetical protein
MNEAIAKANYDNAVSKRRANKQADLQEELLLAEEAAWAIYRPFYISGLNSPFAEGVKYK